jgi:regulator of sirC expression with transglutaminase-like and TPR domain
VANYNLQKMDEAEKSAREAVKLDPEHKIPKASHLRGIILAQKREYSGAVEQLKGYLAAAPNASDAETVRKQIAEIERVQAASASQTPSPPPNNP